MRGRVTGVAPGWSGARRERTSVCPAGLVTWVYRFVLFLAIAFGLGYLVGKILL